MGATQGQISDMRLIATPIVTPIDAPIAFATASSRRACQAITCPLWPFRGGVHPYTQKRLQEAVSDEAMAEGTQDSAIASPGRNGLLEAVPVESGAGALPAHAEHSVP
jgi:hypothetical protein